MTGQPIGANRMAFADVLRDRLDNTNLSELARQTGLNRQQIHRYVRGEAIPRADAFMAICVALDIDPHHVFGHPDDLNRIVQDFPTRDVLRLSTFRKATDEILPCGIYQIIQPSVQKIGLYARVAVQIADRGDRRTFYIRHPGWIYETHSPSNTREIFGFVLWDHSENCQMVGVWRNAATLSSSLHHFFFGPPHPRTGMRSGIHSVPDNNPINIHPFSSRVILIARPDQTFQQVFRESSLVELSTLPGMMAELFEDPPKSPDILWGRQL